VQSRQKIRKQLYIFLIIPLIIATCPFSPASKRLWWNFVVVSSFDR